MPTPASVDDGVTSKSKRNERKWTINFIRMSFGMARWSCKTVIYLQCELIDLQSRLRAGSAVLQPQFARLQLNAALFLRSSVPLTRARVYVRAFHFTLFFSRHSAIITAERDINEKKKRYEHVETDEKRAISDTSFWWKIIIRILAIVIYAKFLNIQHGIFM